MSARNPATGQIKAIETHYAGCRFRSRLEARWAVFFDTLGIAWEYEPQGFIVDGKPYLPDFWMPRLRRWVEVKGDPAGLDTDLCLRFAFEQNTRLMILGPIPPDHDRPPAWMTLLGWPELMSDPLFIEHHGWRDAVPVYREYFDGRNSIGLSDYVSPLPPAGEWLTPSRDEHHSGNPAREAYTAARSARFEHGERGR